MKKLTGLPAGSGIELGSAFIYRCRVLHVEPHSIENVNEEFEKLGSALKQAEVGLVALTQRAREGIGKAEAEILVSLLMSRRFLLRVSIVVQGCKPN